MGSLELHDATVDEVVRRLEASGKYDWIEKNVPYTRNGLCGELDVIAFRRDYNVYHVYEIKSTFNGDKRRSCAFEQLRRCDKAFRRRHIKGVYVHPDRERGLDYLHAERVPSEKP